ncbi:MAG: DUF3343 domain-containing protein [Clostridia bacterium]|nr:DUF3343 domain-containing protein [Clostridia bacterium]
MADILAQVGAITTANRISRELEKSGCLGARVVHTPAVLSSGGCSYSVIVPGECLAPLIKVSSETGFKIKKIYRERAEGGGSVYDEIS